MKETEFKTLMYCDMYVDVNLLEKGIYGSTKPFIYSKEETIESLDLKAEKIRDSMGVHHVSDTYFENLKQCQLVPITIQINHDQTT